VEGAERACAEARWRQEGLRRGRAPGALRVQDRLLRAGLHADARGGRRARLAPQLWRRRAHVARRLHHPLGVPGRHQESLRQGPRPHEPAARPVLPRQGDPEPGRLAPRRGGGGDERRAGAGVHDRARVLRRLPRGPAAGQPAAGAARLLRRAHLRKARQAARRVLPHQLDGARGHHLRLDLLGLSGVALIRGGRARAALHAATRGIALALGAVAASRADDAPSAEITNGLVTARLYLPDPLRGHYRGTRFDWAGDIYSLRYAGHEFSGTWFDSYDPLRHDAIMGPVEEFLSGESSLGYAEAKPGEGFVRIGVGVVRKPEEKPYERFRAYEIVDPGKRTIVPERDRITFEHELSGPGGYAYVYRKT